MKKICFLLPFFMVFSFCKNKKPNPTSNAETVTTPTETNEMVKEGASSFFTQDSVKLSSKLCDNDIEEECAEAIIRYVKATGEPQEAAQKINAVLKDFIINATIPDRDHPPKEKTFEAAVKAFIDDYEVIAAEEEEKSFLTHFSSEVDCDILFESEEMVCISVLNYNFSGGAHGNFFTTLFNFDKKTGAQIKVDDILSDKNKLSAILEVLAKEYYEVEEGQSLKDIGFYYEGDNFPVNDNVGILKDSLIFEYNPYEVGPYVLGNMSLKIAKSEVKEFLK